MTKSHSVASFVLRFTQEMWQDAQGEPHVQWRGHIRHVQGDEEERFTDFAEAAAFIQRYLTQLTLDALTGGQPINQEKVLHESFKLWEQFASSYTDLMFQAVEQTIKQSEMLQEQVAEARQNMLKAWQFPAQPDQPRVLEALQTLQAQVQALAEKLDGLEERLSKSQM